MEKPINESGGEIHEKLSKKQIFSYSVGHVINDLTAAMWFSYLLVYLRTKMSLSEAGIVFLSGQVADGFATPLAGILSDATKSDGFMARTLGKRKSWLAIGAITVTLFFGLVFPLYSDHVGESIADSVHSSAILPIQIAVFSAGAAFFNIGWAILQVNHLALVPEITDVDSERVLLYSLRNAAGVLSNIVVFALFTLFSYIVSADEIWRYMALSVIGIGGFCTLVFLIGVKEKVVVSGVGSSSESIDVDSSPVADGDWKSWFSVPTFYSVTGVYCTARLTVNVSQVYLVIFAINSMRMSMQSQSLMPLALYLASFAANFAVKPLSARLRLKWVFLVGVVLCCLSLAVFFVLAKERLDSNVSDAGANLSYGVVLLLGAGNSFILVTGMSMQARLVGKNRKSGGFVYGAMSLADKFSNGLAVYVINLLSVQCDHCSDDHPPLIFGIRMIYVFTLVPAAAAIFGALCALHPRFVEEADTGGQYALLESQDLSDHRLRKSHGTFSTVQSVIFADGFPDFSALGFTC